MIKPDPDILYKQLLELSVIDKRQLDNAREICRSQHIPLTTVLIDNDLISDENLGKIAADLLNFPYIRLSEVTIPDEVLHLVPEVVAIKQQMIIFKKDKDGTHLAMIDPANMEVRRFLEKKTGEKVIAYYATQRDINQALHLYKKGLQESFNQLLNGQITAASQDTRQEAPITKIVDLLIEYAYSNRVSDIHIEPEENETVVRFRIDGVMHDVLHYPKKIHDQIISRLKVLSKLRTDEHLSAQDGKIQMKLPEENLDIRLSIVPVQTGENAVMRLLSSKSRQFGLNDLGMTDKDLDKVKANFTKPYGMVISTGPTGSGKTTSIYAVLKILNTRDKNIATIEDPVEYEITGISQIQTNPKTNLTFAHGLRSILRQDPDIIFVGEIRDGETASIAINSAMTGHLVLTTLHTNDAATALPRLIDMGIEPFLVASTVNVIIAQRLVRKICEKCKVSYTITLAQLNTHFEKLVIKKHFGSPKEIRIYRGKGCSVCHKTGYSGRIGIFEVLEVSKSVQQLIHQKETAETIKNQGIKEGMTTMHEDGLDKIRGGVTTLEEILRATKE